MTPLSDLRQSTNDTARVARANLLLFLVVWLFLALLVASTDDLLLLKRARLDLPLMEIGVPIDLFYLAAPIIFLLLHLNLFLRLNRLAQVAGLLREEIDKLDGVSKKSTQTALLFPFDFLQVLLYATGRPAMSKPPPIWRLFGYLTYERAKYGHFFALLAIVAAPMFVLPLLLLIWMQLRFLPYQSELITLVHQCTVALDVAMQTVLMLRLGVFGKLRALMARGPSPMERLGAFMYTSTLSLWLLAPVAFSWQVAVIPGSTLERNSPFSKTQSTATQWAFDDWWNGGDCAKSSIRTVGAWRRYLYLPGTSIGASERPPEIVAAYLQIGEDPAKAWKFVGELDLSDRSLRYGWFESSEFWRTNFAESELHCANFRNGTVREAVFDGATLHETDFEDANLRGASFEEVTSSGSDFTDADLRGSRLTGATFYNGTFLRARLHGTSGTGIRFFGTKLQLAKFHGADVSGSDFFGADLKGAEFYGTDMEDTEYHGASLTGAEFYGVDLSGAKLEGVDASDALFYGTNLRHADIKGTSLYDTNFYASDLRPMAPTLTDIRDVRWSRPKKWGQIVQKIRDGLDEGGESPTDVQEFLDKIAEDASEDFGSRGLAELQQPKCVWTDRKGPFRGWDDPLIRLLERTGELPGGEGLQRRQVRSLRSHGPHGRRSEYVAGRQFGPGISRDGSGELPFDHAGPPPADLSRPGRLVWRRRKGGRKQRGPAAGARQSRIDPVASGQSRRSVRVASEREY